VRYTTVAGFIADAVRLLHGSSKSISNQMSSLKVFSHHLGLPWLSVAEQYRLARVTKQLQLEDTVAIQRKRPMVLSMIQRYIREHLDCAHSSYDLLRATLALVAHNGLLRGGEVLGGLRARDVTWEPRNRSVLLHLPPTKTNRTGAGVDVRITDYKGASAYKYLLAWFNSQHLHGRGDAFVFPEVLRSGRGGERAFNFHRPASKKWSLGVVRHMAQCLGADPRCFSMHSFRAGGATDLFILGVTYAKIKTYGRWKSDAALVYYREEVEVSAAVAAAFGEQQRGHQGKRNQRRVGVKAGRVEIPGRK
jgi:hypothetical protein